MVIFMVLRVSSVGVSASLQEILNVAKCLTDIHPALPSSCFFIINSMRDVQGENTFYFFSPMNYVFLEISVLRFKFSGAWSTSMCILYNLALTILLY
jgi:hypothetical protein